MTGPSERELEVFLSVVEHASVKRAATALGLSRMTVAEHLRHLYTKVGAAGRTHAAVLLWPRLRDRYRL